MALRTKPVHPMARRLLALATSARATSSVAATLGLPAVLLLVVWVLRRVSRKPPRGRPAATPPLSNFSLIGHGLEIYNNYDDLMWYYVDLVKKYGKTVRLVVGPALAPTDEIILVTSPENVKHMLKDNFENYIKGPKMIERTIEFTGYGIFGTDGEAWYHNRKTASTIFSSDNMKNQMTRTMINNADTLIQAFRDAGKDGTVPINIESFFLDYALETFCEIGMGVQLGILKGDAKPEWRRFANSWDGMLKLCPSRHFQPLWKIQHALAKLKKWGLPVGFICGPELEIAEMHEYANSVINKIVKQRQSEGALKLAAESSTASPKKGKADSPKSPSRRSVSAHDDTKRLDLVELFMDTSPRPSIEELRDHVKSFLLGGRDTTGTTLTWTFYEISKNPKIEARLREEAAKLPLKDQSEFYNYVKEMKYTEAVIKETVRLHTPLVVDGKYAVHDDVLPDGTFVPQGAMLSFPPFVMARDEELWGPDASTYRPERWLEMAHEPSPYVYSPFQAGPRMCLGKDLAIMEAKSVVAVLMHSGVAMRLWEGTPEPRYQMAGTIQVKAPGMLMKVTVDQARA